MTTALDALSAGLGLGSIYALVALGFVIIYKSMRLLSFAQPAFMLSAAVLVSYLAPSVGFLIAVLLSTLAVAGLALGVERIAIRPMVGKELFVIAVITIGVDIVLRVVAGAFIGVSPRSIGDPWGLDVVAIGGVSVAQRHLAAFAAMAVIVGLLFAFFRFTAMGLAMRAAANDQEAAMTQGVNVSVVFALSWAIAGALAAIAGVFAATGGPIDQNLWLIALAALPAIVLGGFDSLGGAVIGGLIIGVVETMVSTFHHDLFPSLDANVGKVSPYVVMVLVLLVRPYGLFGTREVARV